MRRAASALLYRALWLGWILTLSCSDGGGRTNIFGSPAPYGMQDPVSGVGGQAGEASATAQAGQAAAAGALGGSSDFGSETSGGGETGGGAGAAGMSGAGASGTAGGAGTGEPHPNGGNAGATSSGGAAVNAGAGGSAGSAGSAGNAGAPSGLKICAEACKTAQDCRIGSLDYGHDCNLATHRCETLGSPCRSSLECLPAASLWFLDCSSDADCFYFDDDACVSVAGAGKCARLASGDDVELSGCEAPTADALLLPRFGGVGSVLVCADAGRRCADGVCVAACRSHDACGPAQNGSLCDLASGACRCVKDADCGGAGVSHCNVTSGVCECASATDCQEVAGSDACVAGRCGCSSVAACNGEPVFAGTKLVCE